MTSLSDRSAALALHHRSFVFDGHTDVPTRLAERPADLRDHLADGHVDLPRLRVGGVDGLVFALWVPPSLDAQAGLTHARELWQGASAQLRPGELTAVGSPAELLAVEGGGAVGVVWARTVVR